MNEKYKVGEVYNIKMTLEAVEERRKESCFCHFQNELTCFAWRFTSQDLARVIYPLSGTAGIPITIEDLNVGETYNVRMVLKDIEEDEFFSFLFLFCIDAIDKNLVLPAQGIEDVASPFVH